MIFASDCSLGLLGSSLGGRSMARPRVFISSTFYDLRQVREDLERAVRELGCEPVRHEVGAIPYGKNERLETAAYREVELCDIIVCVVGGRFGSESKDYPGSSITQAELRRALDRGIQVFIFVEKSVLGEFSTYELNKATASVRYRFVDDVKVFQFLEELHKLPRNNAIAPFEIASDITTYLREQFAGLFHQFLQEQKRTTEVRALEEIKAVAGTLKELVRFLTEERRQGDEAIKLILLANHPLFRRLADVTGVSYRVYFANRKEMGDWLSALGWEEVQAKNLDADSLEEWTREGEYIKFRRSFFDEHDQLVVISPQEWDNEWIELRSTVPPDDDVPF